MNNYNEFVMKEFLTELSKLTKKYKIEIGGCGCCGSPWVAKLEDDKNKFTYQINKKDADNLRFDKFEDDEELLFGEDWNE